MTTLPTGETLPEYDGGPADGVDIDAMHRWLIEHHEWGTASFGREVKAIRAVLAALQAVGDATLVKNGTYRMLRGDARDVERLAARLTNAGHAGLLIECGGNPVTAAIALLDAIDFTASATQEGQTGP